MSLGYAGLVMLGKAECPYSCIPRYGAGRCMACACLAALVGKGFRGVAKSQAYLKLEVWPYPTTAATMVEPPEEPVQPLACVPACANVNLPWLFGSLSLDRCVGFGGR